MWSNLSSCRRKTANTHDQSNEQFNHDTQTSTSIINDTLSLNTAGCMHVHVSIICCVFVVSAHFWPTELIQHEENTQTQSPEWRTRSDKMFSYFAYYVVSHLHTYTRAAVCWALRATVLLNANVSESRDMNGHEHRDTANKQTCSHMFYWENRWLLLE